MPAVGKVYDTNNVGQQVSGSISGEVLVLSSVTGQILPVAGIRLQPN